MNGIRVLRKEEVAEVSGGVILAVVGIVLGVASLAVGEFALGYEIGKDLAANDAK